MWFKKTMGILAVLMLLLAACQPSASESPSASEGAGASVDLPPQVLRVDLGGEPPTLDPTQATDSQSIQVLRSITHPLAYFDADLNIVDGLASWEISADGQTVTFTLHDGIAYSDGQPIVAEDFVYSWKRLIDPRNAAGYSYVLSYVEGGAELLGADPEVDDVDAMLDAFGVEAPDESTFVVHLAEPAAFFPYVATLWVTVPLREDMVFSEAEGYISSGPMQLVSWEHNASIVLEPNKSWAGEPVSLERIEMAMIADPTASLAAYEADELDIGGVPSQEVARIEDDPDLSEQILRGDILANYYFGYDLVDPNSPFARSVTLRRAFQEAVDKETMIQVAFGGIGTVANSIVPPGMPGYQDTVYMPYDVEQAQADFETALGELGITAADLHLQIGYNTDANHENKVEFLQQQWRDAFGIEVEAVGLEWGAYLDRLANDPFDIFRLGWGADFPHPHNFLYDLAGCGSGNNNTGYCNEEADALMAQAAVTPALEDQIPLYNQAQDLIMADSPMLMIRFSSRFTLVKPWVQDLVATSQDSSTGELFYSWASIAPH
ncbi:MAG TPA: peptide ABC transporter substrate-binding protein [Candidatus Limnocylindria bacterium]|jgi:oligopeptide transport system substrate-binding protein|nr:peptide ABC transporter substrate-binding protein [Candidatus Limnocylindria bacterium]